MQSFSSFSSWLPTVLALIPAAPLNVQKQRDQPGKNVLCLILVGRRSKISELTGDDSVGSFFPIFF